MGSTLRNLKNKKRDLRINVFIFDKSKNKFIERSDISVVDWYLNTIVVHVGLYQGFYFRKINGAKFGYYLKYLNNK